MIENLAQLEAHLSSEEIPTGEDLFVSVSEWHALAHYVGYPHFVPATPDEPAMFWFKGRRIRQHINRE